jgi:glycosyltransferase involved in cell wall biosynthesis
VRFLFIASGRSTPATRFRVDQYLPSLRAAGHQCDVAYSFPEKYDYFPWLGWRISQRLKRVVRHYHVWLAQRRRYDAILIEREVFDDDTSNLEAAFRKATPRLILDVDDGIFLRHAEKFDTIAPMCDVAIAGNRHLQDYLRQRCREVVLVPTCIRMADYPLRPIPTDPHKPVIGWIGTTHNVVFLSVAARALREVAQRHSFRLLIVANTDQRLAEVDLSGVDFEFRRWDPNREVADLHEMDIGLMPLPDDQDWMKYKCGLKLLQYLAVGTPGIASPIGVNAEIVEGNQVGRAAATDQQWEDALEELLGDANLRRQLGGAGRDLVQQRFSIEANWTAVENALTGAPRTKGESSS